MLNSESVSILNLPDPVEERLYAGFHAFLISGGFPDELLDSKTVKRILASAFDSFTSVEKKFFLQRVVGVSYPEIADSLHITEDSARDLGKGVLTQVASMITTTLADQYP